MFCNYCGRSNPDDALYCSKCGRQLATKEAPREAPATLWADTEQVYKPPKLGRVRRILKRAVTLPPEIHKPTTKNRVRLYLFLWALWIIAFSVLVLFVELGLARSRGWHYAGAVSEGLGGTWFALSIGFWSWYPWKLAGRIAGFPQEFRLSAGEAVAQEVEVQLRKQARKIRGAQAILWLTTGLLILAAWADSVGGASASAEGGRATLGYVVVAVLVGRARNKLDKLQAEYYAAREMTGKDPVRKRAIVRRTLLATLAVVLGLVVVGHGAGVREERRQQNAWMAKAKLVGAFDRGLDAEIAAVSPWEAESYSDYVRRCELLEPLVDRYEASLTERRRLISEGLALFRDAETQELFAIYQRIFDVKEKLLKSVRREIVIAKLMRPVFDAEQNESGRAPRVKKETVASFAERIRKRRPDLADRDDHELVGTLIAARPEFHVYLDADAVYGELILPLHDERDRIMQEWLGLWRQAGLKGAELPPEVWDMLRGYSQLTRPLDDKRLPDSEP